MTDAERRLLLLIANVLSEQLEEQADDHGTADNAATELRSLIEQVRPR